VEPLTPLAQPSLVAATRTDPERPLAQPATDANPTYTPAAGRDTLSITNRGAAPPSDWDEGEDDGVRTAIARPAEVLGKMSAPSDEDMRMTHETDGSALVLQAVGGRSRWLVVVLVLLALMAVLGGLVLLEVIPLGDEAPAQTAPQAQSPAEPPPLAEEALPGPTPASPPSPVSPPSKRKR
jgi:hypothetical protein